LRCGREQPLHRGWLIDEYGVLCQIHPSGSARCRRTRMPANPPG
jgi:hypothetical protein